MKNTLIDAAERPSATASRDGDSAALSAFLQQAGECVAAVGPEYVADRERLHGLRLRLREQRCHLAVLGQFKRGKSTLVNALLGEAVLPAAVVPLTSIPTFLHGGAEPAARVSFDDDRAAQQFAGTSAGALAEFLAQFVTETANPHNRLGVRAVDVAFPAPLLEEGLALIDTPGIGSTFRHNTEATVNFLPQCDAALFVVSADPPITEVEVEFLKLAHRKLARLFFVLNKADYLDAEDRRTAVAFLQRVLCEQLGYASPPPVFCVSARQGLAARQERDDVAWQRSGMAEIERRISGFLLDEKTEVVQSAICRQAGDVLADVQRRLRLTLQSLHMPLAELDGRIRLFEESLTEIDEQRIVLMDRIAKEETRLAAATKKRADELLPASRAFLQAVVRASQEQCGAKWTEEAAREAIAAAVPGFFEREFGAVHERCAQELHEGLLPYRRRAAELVASVHRLVEKLFDVPFEPPQEEIPLVRSEQPHWRTHKWTIKFGSIPESWIDGLLPRRLRHARVGRRIAGQVEYLVTRNVGDLRWSTLENLKGSVEQFRAALNDSIQEAIETTRRALDAACRRRREDSATVAPETARLDAAAAGIQSLRARIPAHATRRE